MSDYPFPDYQVAGDADTTIYLFHGAYGAKDYFRNEIEVLTRAGYRVVAWDAPGYGISPLPAGGLRIEALAQTAARLIERTGTAINIVVGHSMSGIMGPLLTCLLPGKVHGLVISATLGSHARRSEEEKQRFLAERIGALQQDTPFRESAEVVIRGMLAPGASGKLVDLVIETGSSMRKETLMAAIEAIVHYNGLETFKRVAVPTLLIAGAEDKVGRADGMRELTSVIPDSRFVSVPGAGHYSFAENPDAFNAALFEFVREIESRQGKPAARSA